MGSSGMRSWIGVLALATVGVALGASNGFAMTSARQVSEGLEQFEGTYQLVPQTDPEGWSKPRDWRKRDWDHQMEISGGCPEQISIKRGPEAERTLVVSIIGAASDQPKHEIVGIESDVRVAPIYGFADGKHEWRSRFVHKNRVIEEDRRCFGEECRSWLVNGIVDMNGDLLTVWFGGARRIDLSRFGGACRYRAAK